MTSLRRLSMAALIGLGFLAPGARAQIALSPPIVEVDLSGRSATESVRLINMGKRDVEVSVRVEPFDLDETNRYRSLPSTEDSLDRWMVVQPGRFVVPAGQSRAVRFSIRPKSKPAPGEHRAMLFFEEIARESEPTAMLKALFRVGAAIYAHVGEVRRVGRVVSTSCSREGGLLEIASEGSANARMTGRWGLWTPAAFPGIGATTYSTAAASAAPGARPAPPAGLLFEGSLPTVPVLPGTRRNVLVPLPKEAPEGELVLHLLGTLGGATIDLAVPCRLPAAPPTPEPTPAPLAAPPR